MGYYDDINTLDAQYKRVVIELTKTPVSVKHHTLTFNKCNGKWVIRIDGKVSCQCSAYAKVLNAEFLPGLLQFARATYAKSIKRAADLAVSVPNKLDELIEDDN